MADFILAENQEDIESTKPEQNSELEETEMTQDQEDGEPSGVLPCDNLVVNPDDLLPPIVKLEKYAESETVFNRQVVARNLLETLRMVVDDDDQASRVVDVLCTLADDTDPSVRTEVIQQMPYICLFCNKSGSFLSNIVRQCFVPMVIRLLTDINNQVRKTSQATLLLTVEQGIIDEVTLEVKVCGLVLDLTESRHMDDCRTEAVNLMGKLAPLVGKELTERLFLPCFVNLCLDASFQVRKVCAENFGEFCAIVDQDSTESVLLPKFYSLCEDSVCGVRKVCAEVFLSISRVCSMETRHNDLAPAYINLLCDTSRWVRMAAFQSLGPFISTFAEPSKTGLYYNPMGILTVKDPPSCDVEIESEEPGAKSDSCPTASSGDSIVPSCHDAANCDSSVQSTECHNGCYSTVIELSSENSHSDHQTNSLLFNDCDYSDSKVDFNNVNGESISGQLQECETDVTVNNLSCYAEDTTNSDCETYCEPCQPSWDDGAIEFISSEQGDVLRDDEKVFENGDIYSHDLSPSENISYTVVLNGIDISDDTLEEAESADALDLLDDSSLSGDSERSTCNSTHVECHLRAKQPVEFNCLKTVSDDDLHYSIAESEEHHSNLNGESAFNHFQFWRNPIPDLELNFDLGDDVCDKIHEVVNSPINGYDYNYVKAHNKMRNWSIISNCTSSSAVTLPSLDNVKKLNYSSVELNRTSMNCSWNITLDEPSVSDVPNEDPVLSLQNLAFVHEQDIVPPELLLKYLNMTNESKAQTFNSELVHHCAYSLPAVALTLGRNFWPCLRETYNTLASELRGLVMQWKIRRTLASSMHQLAVILGPDISARDLLPVFSDLIRDIDEVRIGVLRHLSEFLEVLRDKDRIEYLPRISEFIHTDNERNWRFRLTLAEQLIPIANLYEPSDVQKYLVPLSFALVRDKVSAVRLIAARVMAVMMRRMGQSPTPTLTKSVLAELAEQFIHARKWLHRQIYVYLCQEFIRENSLPPDQFAEDAMPHLLYLCWDRVANVRLAIARCLAVVIWPQSTFSDPSSPHQELLLQAIHTLQSDVDADVRYYANMVETHECTCLHHSLTNDMVFDDHV